MKIITISGLDGSGKSTQINLLKNYLESQGKKVFYFHAIEFSLAQKLSNFKKKYCLICKIKGFCNIDSQKSKAVTKANNLQILLRKIFLQIDLARFNFLYKKLAKDEIDYLLSDRYFYDTLVNIEYLLKKEVAINYPIPAPNVSVYLKADPELIVNRDRIPEQGLQYLIDKKIVYDKFSNIFKMNVINGNESKEMIQEEIKKLI